MFHFFNARYIKSNRLIIALLLAVNLLPSVLFSQVSGIVYRDYNGNGVQGTALPNLEPGVANITVKAFDASGAQVGLTAMTSATGTYSIATSGVPVRVEFSNLPTSNYFGVHGTGNNTSVQFVPGASSNVNLGIQLPADYCEANPLLTTPCYVSGDPLSSGSLFAADPSIVSLDYNHASPKTSLLTASQVGSVWGIAYNKMTDKLYLAAYLRRHSGLGPGGLGTIYVYPNAKSGGGALSTITIPNVGIIGTNAARGLSGTNPANHDPTAFDLVGKVGLGDIDIDNENQMLYVVNLNDKLVYKVDLTAASPTAVSLPSYTAPTCTKGNFRPFALKYRNGKLYLGGVCSGELENSGSTSSANLTATVFEYDIAGGSWSTVSSFALNYPKESPYPGYNTGWFPWINEMTDVDVDHSTDGEVFFTWPTPLLSDIEFADDGAMLIGFFDRSAMQFGARNYGTNTSNTSTLYYIVSGGDILRATLSGATYVREPHATAAAEFFGGEEFPAPSEEHLEASLGGMAVIAGKGQVVLTGIDPSDFDSGGFYYLSTTTGEKLDSIEIYSGANTGFGSGPAPTFGKAAGLGDAEALCSPAPIEIGNRVWLDTNSNGIQDPNESGIGNVTVELYADFDNNGVADAPGVLATTNTTNTGTIGTWYFNSSNVTDGDPSTPGSQAGLVPNKHYFVVIGSADWASGVATGDLAGYSLTTSNAIPMASLSDVSDNDATLIASSPRIALVTGVSGDNNHTFDFGFTSCIEPSGVTLTITSPTCSGSTENNNGKITLTAITGADKYGVSTGATYSGTPSYAAATPIAALPQDLQTAIPNTGGTYTIRFFNGVDCYLDTTITVNSIPCAAPPDPCSAGETGGQVWLDVDGDGIKDAGETLGLAGLTVTAFDCDGNIVADTITGIDGYYSFGILSPAPTTLAPYRIEFSGLPTGYAPTSNGADGRTDVQFITAPECAVDFGAMNPVEYCGTISIILPCYATDINQSSVAYFPYTNTGTTPTPTESATISEAGALWGAAGQTSQKRVFFSAVLKRHVPLGPLGLGGVYAFDYASGTPTMANSFDVTSLTLANSAQAISGGSINLGSIIRSGGSDYTLPPSGPSVDLDAFAKIGTVGLADADMGQDSNTLWLINLNQKALISVDVSGATAGAANQYLISMLPGAPSGCTNGELRPWGLEFANGKGYLGLVCSAENGGTAADLHAYVYSFNPANPGAGLTLELDFAMTYDREKEGGNGNAEWLPWTNTWHTEFEFQNWHWPQPVLSDIEIDNAGGMTIGLLDRTSFQLGYKNYPAVSGSTDPKVESIATGDIIKFCWTGSAWATEGTAGCPDNDAGGYVNANSIATDGLAGQGEFYYGDYYKDGSNNYGHEEVALGSLVYNPLTNEVLSTVYDPTEFTTNGVHWYDATTGARNNSYLVTPSTGDVTFFAKGTSLGDMEIICLGSAPLQIGNYVWIDADKDGTQDPCETPLSGVKVALYKDVAGTLTYVATTTTGANGEYYFTGLGTAGETWVATSGTDSILPNMSYKIVFGFDGTTAQYASGNLTLAGVDYTLTTADSGEGTSPDLNDSDASLMTVAGSSFPSISILTESAGSVNHTYDAGFFVSAKVALGNLVFMDTDEDGTFDSGTDMGLDGVIVWLFQTGDDPSVDAPVAVDTTAGGGFYLFDELNEGSYFVFLPTGNFATGAPLENKASDAVEGGDTATDDNADENGQNALVSGGVRSSDIVLTDNGEPTGETGAGTYTGLLDDNNVNMTVDFGFKCGTPPDLSVSPAVLNLCAPATVDLATDITLTDANNLTPVVGYPKYYGSAADAVADTNPLASAIISMSDTVWVRLNTVGGCWDTVSVVINILESLDIVARDTSICAGSSADLATLFTQDASAGTLSYYGTLADAQAETSAISSTVTPAATTKYFIRKETAAGCFDIDSVTVTVNQIPVINDATLVCSGSSAPSTYDFALTGTWQITSQPAGANAQVDANGLVTAMTLQGNYVFLVTVNGCTDTATLAVPQCCPAVICVPVTITKN